MDNHKLMVKISRILPSSFSSCHFRNLPTDVAESSINLITKQNHHSSLSLSPQKLPKTPSTLPKTLPLSHAHAHAQPHPNKTDKPATASLHHSSTSTAGWFTSSDDVDAETFFSLSSISGDSFRIPTATSQRFKRRDDIMKSIDEVGRRSFSSAASSKCSRQTAAGPKKASKVFADDQLELGSDHFSTELYYGGGCRRRRGGRERRRMKKSGGGGVIGESYAVEKRSRDPRSDFMASMVEMIVEKGIFAAADLERLLRCFLSLNTAAYHGIIFDVYSEICQTLFTN